MATKKNGSSAAAVGGNMPDGFTRSTGSFPSTWEYDTMPILQGRCIEIRKVPVKRGRKVEDSNVMTVAATDTGEMFAVWESAALTGLFAEVKPGNEVFIEYKGKKDMGAGKQPMKLFDSGYRA